MVIEARGSETVLDTRALGKALRERVDGEVRFDVGSRGTCATDGSNYRQVLGDCLRDLKKLFADFGYDHPSLYGHFGQGCVHTRIPFELTTAEGVTNFRAFLLRAADLVASYGASLIGEHGDGQVRSELLPRMFGEDVVAAFGRVKALFDPDNRMNPGKVVDPYRVDENLRLGSVWRPDSHDTHFSYPDDEHSFDRAVLRCVGNCRTHEGGVVCPSYRATGEGRQPPSLTRAVTGQTHCHQHAVTKDDADREPMRRAGIDASVLDAGCCGLAGDFGFEQGHDDLSMTVAEQGVLPTVRDTVPSALVLADGFSCRTQIEQGDTGRRALRLAEAPARAMDGRHLPADHPEKPADRPEDSARDGRLPAAGAGACALGAAAAGTYWFRNRQSAR
ncbi:FAD-linked oxidase C-terminal domain-containing protein [Streptomyces sp. NPDC002698]|uniref:FAD-linked oxidase C-terminal domain-containing protein n=1 Tax=Streptomyces sp. NPDC002698 TaxID=3364660 RepID=UPI0036A9A65B